MPHLTEWFAQAGLPAPARDIAVSGFQADSRKVQPHTVFVAIVGAEQNGWDYVDAAIENGAAAVLSDVQQQELSVPFIPVKNARLAYAKLCAAMYPEQPQYAVAVTGTNGKTSVAEFYRQLWALAGEESASIGTLGMTRTDGTLDTQWPSENTSPAPDIVHQELQRLAQENVQHVAIEASSHGLHQYRLDGVRFTATAFTNLSQDHLDYHGTMEDYFQAKARLFRDWRVPAIINADDDYGKRLLDEIPDALCYGEAGKWLRLSGVKPTEKGLRYTLQHEAKTSDIGVALFGPFQVHNIMAATGLALQTGMAWDDAVRLIPKLAGVRGRMENVATHPSGAPIFVDYAHTPDALKHLLISLRAHTAKKLHVVFGCGGDRDTTKRYPMGSIAAQYADHVVVTDDNPRTEDPEHIRAAILSAAPAALEIADRSKAIHHAVKQLGEGDILVVAGKGHETYQIIGTQKQKFNDAQTIKEALETL